MIDLPLIVGILALLLFLLFVGIPIAFSLGITGMIGIILLRGWDICCALTSIIPYSTVNQWGLLVLPLFILMGNIALEAGIADRAFDVAYKMFAGARAGLAMASTAACAIFAAVTGSSAATVVTIGKVAIPQMLKHKYDPKLACGCIAAGGFLGMEIPPSGTMVFYGIIAQQSIAKLLIAIIFPGLLTAALFILGTSLITRLKPNLVPISDIVGVRLRDKIGASFHLWEVTLLFLIVMGGIYLGIFTVTEAAAVGVFAAIIILLLRKRKHSPRALSRSLLDAASTSCMIFAIFIGATFFASFLIQAGVPQYVASVLISTGFPPMILLCLILAFYLPLGMLLDPFSIIIVTIPIFLPIIVSAGFDPIWFGVICLEMIELSLITPPVGLNVFLTKAISPPEIPLTDIFKGTAIYFVMESVVIILLIIFPQIALWLPNHMLG